MPEKYPYASLEPSASMGFPFMPRVIQAGYTDWPSLPTLFYMSSPGVNTSRDAFILDIDQQSLESRLDAYFDTEVSDEQMRRLGPDVMASTKRFDAVQTRKYLQGKGRARGKIVRYEYRPFDTLHLYWYPETKLLDEKREELFAAAQAGTVFLTSRQKRERDREGSPFYITRHLADRHLTRPGSNCFPLALPAPEQQGLLSSNKHAQIVNLSPPAQNYLTDVTGADGGTFDNARLLWLHIVAIGYAPLYLAENRDGLGQDWPRIPLPASKEALATSAALGATIAALLDAEASAKGVTAGALRAEQKAIGNFSMVQGKPLDARQDLRIEAGWGHPGKDGVTMPGKGKLIERDYTEAERAAIAEGAAALGLSLELALSVLGEQTCDVYLNDRACWKNIPAKVWEYTIGGYQVIKKWLSYREAKLLGRAITPDEAHYVRDMARRIAAICLMQPQLDANYAAIKADLFAWEGTKETTRANAQEPRSDATKNKALTKEVSGQ
jgi:hypothetical protein